MFNHTRNYVRDVRTTLNGATTIEIIPPNPVIQNSEVARKNYMY